MFLIRATSGGVSLVGDREEGCKSLSNAGDVTKALGMLHLLCCSKMTELGMLCVNQGWDLRGEQEWEE